MTVASSVADPSVGGALRCAGSTVDLPGGEGDAGLHLHPTLRDVHEGTVYFVRSTRRSRGHPQSEGSNNRPGSLADV